MKRIVRYDGDLDEAVAGQAVTVVLDEEIDVLRGDVRVPPKDRPEVADQSAAHLIWMSEKELLPHRRYLLKFGTQTVPGEVTLLKHKPDVDTPAHLAGRTLRLNEVGYGDFATTAPIAFDPYTKNRDMGGFIVIDRFTNATVGAGMIEFGLRRATNVQWQALDIHKEARAELKRQKPCVLGFTAASPPAASRPSPTSWRSGSTRRGGARISSTATTCATG